MLDPLRRLSPVVRLAPAKLNLTLAVVGRRDDGYHALHSVFVPLTLADRLSLAPVGGDRDTLHVSGLDAGPPADNLVFRALAAARAAVGGGWAGGPGPAPALAARLDKRIPVAAGLAGGSSDAAATLDGALEAWGAELDEHARHAVAAALGSDVPFFLAGGPALVEGRGERVAPLHGLHGSAGRPARHAARSRSRRPTSSPPSTRSGRTATARSGCRRTHLAEELRAGLTAADLVARAGVLASANDLLPATVARRAGARAVQARPEPAPRPADRPVRLRADAVGALSFGGGGRPAPPRSSGRPWPTVGSIAPGSAEPFVVATAIVSHSQQESEP